MTPIAAPPSQKTPSLWMLVAAAQSAAWLFWLPNLCKPRWESFFSGRSLLESEILLNLVLAFGTYAIYVLFMLPIYYLELPFFEQYKIDDQPWAWRSKNEETRRAFWALTRRSFQLVAVNHLLFVPLLTFIKQYLFPSLTPSFEVDQDWPSYGEMVRDNLFLTVLHDFGFYSTHRIMHSSKWLYSNFHKVHHEYKQNTVVAAQHNHPVDYLLSLILPVLLSTLIVQPHSFVQSQWAIWMLTANLDEHTGYSFPWSPVRWFPFSNATEKHEFHHSINMGCYGSKLDCFDRLFGSDAPYIEWSQKKNRLKTKCN